MHTSAIHNPYSELTPSQYEAAKARRERLEKIASRALVAVVQVEVSQQAPKEDAEPQPTVSPLDEWIERQKAIPLPKKPWFSIEAEIGEPEIVRPRIETIQRACAKYYGVSRSDIISARRTAAVVRPRQVGYYLSKVLTLKSLPEIGRRFGGRDHTSALSGIRKIERLRKTDQELEADLHAIAAAVGGSIA